jgi:hypothetical protein
LELIHGYEKETRRKMKKRIGRMWENNIKMVVTEIGYETMVSNQLAKDRFHSKIYNKTIINLLDPLRTE